MPIGLRTKQTYPVYLDKNEPEESRPALLFRYLSAGDAADVDIQLAQVNIDVSAMASFDGDEVAKATQYAKLLAKAKEVMRPHFAGVLNLPDETTVDTLTETDFWPAFWSFRPTQKMTELDRKKSASAALSAGDRSAKTATPTDATTLPAETAPPASPAGAATVPLPIAPPVPVSAITS
jgi:hypothetical protein